MKDCTRIKNKLKEKMEMHRKYHLSEIYQIIEGMNIEMDNYKHKIRAVLEKRKIDGNVVIEYHKNAIYSLEKVGNNDKLNYTGVA